MSFETERIAIAEARSRAARERLFATLNHIQHRLAPSTLAQEAVDSAVEGVASVARRGAAAVRARPVAVAGFAAAVGLFAARGWIADIVRRKPRNETADAPKGLKAKSRKPAKKELGK